MYSFLVIGFYPKEVENGIQISTVPYTHDSFINDESSISDLHEWLLRLYINTKDYEFFSHDNLFLHVIHYIDSPADCHLVANYNISFHNVPYKDPFHLITTMESIDDFCNFLFDMYGYK